MKYENSKSYVRRRVRTQDLATGKNKNLPLQLLALDRQNGFFRPLVHTHVHVPEVQAKAQSRRNKVTIIS
jgi:hypothetical protein